MDLIMAALRALCPTPKTFLAFAMILLVGGILVHFLNLLNQVVHPNKTKTSKKPRLWLLGTALIIIAIICMIIYVITPPILSIVFGKNSLEQTCPSYGDFKPYCGDAYCHPATRNATGNVTIKFETENCTCLMA